MAGEAAAWFTGTGANKQLNLRLPSGAKGDKGDKGDKGADGANVLPTDAAIKDAINNPASATRAAISGAAGIDESVEPAAAPNTGADVTAIIRAAYLAAAGKPVRIRKPGVYLVDTLLLDQPGEFIVGAGVTLRLKGNATGLALGAPVIRVTSSDVTVRIDGTIDANRGGQDLAAYNAAGGSSGKVFPAIQVQGTSETPITGVNVHAPRIINAMDFAARINFVRGSHFYLGARTCGAGVTFSDCDDLTVPVVSLRELDNNGANIYPHAFDLTNVKNSSFGIVRNVEHMGDDTKASGGTKSDWISGATLTNVSSVAFDQLVMSTKDDPTQAKGVGVSLLTCDDLKIGTTEISGYTDLNFEWGGVINSQFGTVSLDGRYQKSGFSAGGSAWVISNYGYYPGTRSRSQRFSENNTVGSFVSRRHFGDGIDVRAGRNNTFSNGQVYGNRRGLHARYLPGDLADNFANQVLRDIDGNRFVGCNFYYNERGGVEIQDGANTILEGCRSWNNGQAGTHPSGLTRLNTAVGAAIPSGFGTNTSVTPGLSKKAIQLIAPVAFDNQNFTDALSGTAATGKTLSALDPSRYCPGQTIKLVGAGVSGADLFTRVQSVQWDEVTLEDAPSTFPTVAGTGTVSSNGTALTGSGTAFLAELNARYWIIAGGQTRQVIKMASDTDATLDAAFAPNLAAGTAFVIAKTVTNGLPSQQYGVRFAADTVEPQIIGGDFYGNVAGSVLDLSSTMLRVDPRTQAARHPNAPANAQATMDRNSVSSNSVGTSSGTLRLAYFTADRALVATKVRVNTGSAAAAATPTLCRIGVYRENADGSLTLLQSTANDTGLWAAIGSRYTRDLLGSVTLAQGARYAIGILIVTGGTTPNFTGQSALHADEINEAPRTAGVASSFTDLPSSVAAGSIAGTTSHVYGVLVA